MRIRLSSIAEGNWQNTGGKRSKFGLTSNEALELVAALKEHGATLHGCKCCIFIWVRRSLLCSTYMTALPKACVYFAELSKLGLEFSKLNIGGGLGVDYEGSHSDSYFSVNYTINEYAEAVIEIVNKICQEQSISSACNF